MNERSEMCAERLQKKSLRQNEAGVRQLERKIGDICRKVAMEILEKKKTSIHVTERNLEHYLGKELYSYQMANEEDEVGIVRGLAWTSVGGDTLQIEVNVMPGEGEILLTGQLGDVMKESARTRYTYPYSGRSGSERRTVCRHYDGDCNHVGSNRKKSTCRSCHDRRDHTARASTSDWWFKGKTSGCQECGNEDRTCPGEK